VIVSCPAAVALKTSRCRVGTDRRPLASRLRDEAPWNTKKHLFAAAVGKQQFRGTFHH